MPTSDMPTVGNHRVGISEGNRSEKMFSWIKDANTITTKIAPVDISFDVFNI